jgi:hypothetical protein
MAEWWSVTHLIHLTSRKPAVFYSLNWKQPQSETLLVLRVHKRERAHRTKYVYIANCHMQLSETPTNCIAVKEG